MSLYTDEQRQQLLWWDLEKTTWDLFHQNLDEIHAKSIAEDVEPFVVIFRPSNDMPKGSPMPHLQRMIRICSHENIIRLIIVAPQSMRFAWAFVSATSRVLGLDKHADIVSTTEEALERYTELVSRA